MSVKTSTIIGNIVPLESVCLYPRLLHISGYPAHEQTLGLVGTLGLDCVKVFLEKEFTSFKHWQDVFREGNLQLNVQQCPLVLEHAGRKGGRQTGTHTCLSSLTESKRKPGNWKILKVPYLRSCSSLLALNFHSDMSKYVTFLHLRNRLLE